MAGVPASGHLLCLDQGIFPIQKSNPGLPHCRQILYHLSHQGSLKNDQRKPRKIRMDGASWFKGLSYPGGTDWSYPLLGGPKGHSANTSLYTSPEGLLTMFQVAQEGRWLNTSPQRSVLPRMFPILPGNLWGFAA